jgi:hypothetical protein
VLFAVALIFDHKGYCSRSQITGNKNTFVAILIAFFFQLIEAQPTNITAGETDYYTKKVKERTIHLEDIQKTDVILRPTHKYPVLERFAGVLSREVIGSAIKEKDDLELALPFDLYHLKNSVDSDLLEKRVKKALVDRILRSGKQALPTLITELKEAVNSEFTGAGFGSLVLNSRLTAFKKA